MVLQKIVSLTLGTLILAAVPVLFVGLMLVLRYAEKPFPIPEWTSRRSLFLTHLAFVLAAIGFAAAFEKAPEVRFLAVLWYKVKEKDVAETLKYLASDELEGRETGTKGMVKAADYLEQFFKKNNVKPYFQVTAIPYLILRSRLSIL